MMLRKYICAVSLFLLVSGAASAGDCILHITRTACPGQEAESFSKCSGTASCDENKPAISASMCANKAKSSCENKRKNITKYKAVTASYDGTAVENGKDFCSGHPDYPYAKKADCKD